MKKIITTFTLTVFTFFSALAQNNTRSELQAIEATVNLYFDGWATGDTTKLGKAMHSTCHLKSFREGKFNDMPRAEYLSRFKPRARPDSLVTRIISIDITENIAAAKTEIDTGKDIFTDYFNLIKTNDGWYIVDKIAVRKAK